MELIDCISLSLDKIKEQWYVEQASINSMTGIEELKDCRERAIERRDVYRECYKVVKACIDKNN